MVVSGQNPTIGSGLLRLIYLTLAGIGRGLILARSWNGLNIELTTGQSRSPSVFSFLMRRI